MQLHKQAELYIKKHSFKLWFLSSLCLRNRRRKQAFFIYAYLRWVDNTIDESNLSPLEKKEFISRQIKLIGENEHYQGGLSLLPEELFFLEFSQYLNSIKKIYLVDAVLEMVKAIEMDTQRLADNEGIFNKESLTNYMQFMTNSMWSICNHFASPNRYYPENPGIGLFSCQVQMLRDLDKDFSLGYINVCQEDLEGLGKKFFSNPKQANHWKKLRLKHLWMLNKIECSLLGKFSFRIRVFWMITNLIYIIQLAKIENQLNRKPPAFGLLKLLLTGGKHFFIYLVKVIPLWKA